MEELVKEFADKNSGFRQLYKPTHRSNLRTQIMLASKIIGIPCFDLIYLINEKYPNESFFIDHSHFHSRANQRIAVDIYNILDPLASIMK